jgi:hypothetical protein
LRDLDENLRKAQKASAPQRESVAV